LVTASQAGRRVQRKLPHPMALLTVDGISLAYKDRQLLDGVSLSVAEGERIGLLGPNGSGKSTLLSILAGVQQPDEGERILRRDLRIGYLRQEPPLDPSLTVRDAVRDALEGRDAVLAELDSVHTALAAPDLAPERIRSLLARQSELDHELSRLGGHDVEHKVESILLHLDLKNPDARCGTLSGGEQRRVALARLLLSEPELLLLDEPTNHLDAIVTDWLEDWLLEADLTLLMVTHDRYFLDRVVDRIVELDRGKLVSYSGNYTDYLIARAERDDVERHADQVRRSTLRRETAWIRRGPPAQRKKSKARLSQYATLVDSRPDGGNAELEFEIPPGPRLGTRVIQLEGAGKSFGGRVIVPPLDLEVGPGDCIGVAGPNGAGKSTFLALCTGALAPDRGKVLVGETVKIATIDQKRSELDPAKTVLEEVAGKSTTVRIGERTMRVESFLERFLFPGDRKHQKIAELSGGERNRILLAKLMGKGGNVLVLDEPTNDLDVATLRVLEEAISQFEGTVLVVSHDRWFLDRVASRIVFFDGEGGARVHEGSLSLLLDRLAAERVAREAEEREQAKARDKKARAAAAPAEGPRKLTYAEKKELAALPDRIAAAEEKLAEIDGTLEDPAFYARPRADHERLAAERAAADSALAALYRRWEELETIASAAG
jgi:ABC transport system ATP-binding/permease protein